MQLLIDTASSDLLVVLFDEAGHVHGVAHRVNLVRKAEVLNAEITALLTAQGVPVDKVRAVYATIGPGSFMGARSGLLWATTFCMFTAAQLWVAPTFALLRAADHGAFWLPATSTSSYGWWRQAGREVHAVVKGAPRQSIDYAHLLQQWESYRARFRLVADLTQVSPRYFRRPQIGAH